MANTHDWLRGSHWSRRTRCEVRPTGWGWQWRTVVGPILGRTLSDTGWALSRAGADAKATRAMVRLQREGWSDEAAP